MKLSKLKIVASSAAMLKQYENDHETQEKLNALILKFDSFDNPYEAAKFFINYVYEREIKWKHPN